MSKPVRMNIKRQDTFRFTACVEADFDNLDEANAWGETMTRIGQETNVELPTIDVDAKDGNISSMSTNEAQEA